MSSTIYLARKNTSRLIVVLALLIAAVAVFWALSGGGSKPPVQAAPSSLLNVQSNGSGGLLAFALIEINGELVSGNEVQVTMGGDDVTEFSIVDSIILSAGSGGGGTRSTSRVDLSPVIISKRIDQASPLLLQAAHQNRTVNIEIRMYDNDPDSGETRHSFTYTITNGRVVGFRNSGGSPGIPGGETLSVIGQTVEIVDEINSIEYLWDFSTQL